MVFRTSKFDAVNFFNNLFTDEVAPPNNLPAANISDNKNVNEYFEAVPRDEYATALAKMHFPDSYYRNYRIAVSSKEDLYVTEYFTVKDRNNWWVQTLSNDIILQTTICKNGDVTITDNADNTSVKAKEFSDENPFGVAFEEKCGIISLRTLVNIIFAAANGEPVSYGGGIADYSLSFTQTKPGGENLFSFSFVCQNGVSEEYTFSFENAVILSASKSYEGNEIYKMEIKDYRNSLDEIDTESLFSIN
ncbi:MAG: hypothetical protein IKU61_03705 [Clostridia bacterium]|nr:hypothetical protein [Clostridia bacterium]